MELAAARVMVPQQAASAAVCSSTTRTRCLQPSQVWFRASQAGLRISTAECVSPRLSCSVPLRSLRGDLASGAGCPAQFEGLTGLPLRAAGTGAICGRVEPSTDRWTIDDVKQAKRRRHLQRRQVSYRFLQRCLWQERSSGEVGPVQVSLPKATPMRRCSDQQPYGIPDRRVPAYWDVVGLGQAMVSTCALVFESKVCPRCAPAWVESMINEG